MTVRVTSLITVCATIAVTSCGKPAPAPPKESTPAPASTSAPSMPGMTMAALKTRADWAKGAQLFDGLGTFHRTVTTSSPEAQRYFDQGMRLLWAFNHDESTRSFAKAAELDPACAMCLWGVALTVGPNYNQPMMADARASVAFDALQQGRTAAPRATPVERALVDALGKRYPDAKALDPTNSAPVLKAYASAMRAVAKQFPDDNDVQVLFAESMMNLNPWKLWALDGKPAPGTTEIQATFERVLAKQPDHPGANHYYIHAMEASPAAAKALPAADRLGALMPAAGHLVHMPAHILQRVGRYDDAAKANRDGAAADKAYLARTTPLDYYGMYVAHNFQFLAYSTAMSGRKRETIDAVRELRREISDAVLMQMPGTDWYMGELYFAMVRFGMWDEILAESAPDPKLPGLTGAYLIARGTALAAKNRVDEAKAALTELDHLALRAPADYGAGLNLAKDVFAVGALVVEARVASAEHRIEDALDALRRAVKLEDRLAYDEPADWFVPVRHVLGAQLLATGRAADAEIVYREDLKRHPNNGWALFGLAESLKKLKKSTEITEAEAAFKKAWAKSDVTLRSSAY